MHIDPSVLSKTVIKTPDLDFFRNDRNIHGEKVVIATKTKLNDRNISVETYNEEIVTILISTNPAICCYYRRRASTPNIKQISNILSSIKYKYSDCNIIYLVI